MFPSTALIQQMSTDILQGSILGPLHFILYINELPGVQEPKTHTNIYANDIVIYASTCSSEKATKYIQNNLDNLEYFKN